MSSKNTFKTIYLSCIFHSILFLLLLYIYPRSHKPNTACLSKFPYHHISPHHTKISTAHQIQLTFHLTSATSMISGFNIPHIYTRISQPYTINFSSFRCIRPSSGSCLTSDLIPLRWVLRLCLLHKILRLMFCCWWICVRACVCVCVWSGFGNKFYWGSSVAGSILWYTAQTSKGLRFD